MPCHQGHSDSNHSVPSDADQCIHREMIAENRSAESILDPVPQIGLEPLAEPTWLVRWPGKFAEFERTPNPPRTNPGKFSSILKI